MAGVWSRRWYCLIGSITDVLYMNRDRSLLDSIGGFKESMELGSAQNILKTSSPGALKIPCG